MSMHAQYNIDKLHTIFACVSYHSKIKLLRHGWYLDTNLSERLLFQLWQLLGMERDKPNTCPTILVVINQLK